MAAIRKIKERGDTVRVLDIGTGNKRDIYIILKIISLKIF